ncbi:ABC transporter permease [Paenibacillus nanensis]|uniref:ABC transporter permease n=1 Tax=Paenibacillus nanensis TaxID=393251 RepID=A0A3A1UVQ2_9BACL|nr:ABC transporter permease [Paenibacillus nanensis]RIX51511.1 ABC transporter permease [Paenibacillus nanensis]
MNMYLYELRMNRKSAFIWMAALAGIAGLFMSMYPTFAEGAEQFKEVLRTMPEEVLQALGLQIDSMATLLGFYSYLFLYVLLCGAIQAIHLGASIVSKETREKTADFLLAKPVTRSKIIGMKALAALTILLITNVVYFGAAALIAETVQRESFSYSAFVLINLSLLFTQLIFLAVGFAAAMLLPRLRTVLPMSLGVVFAFFMLSAVGATTGDSKLRYLTPFQYFDRAYIVQHKEYELEFVVTGVIVIAVCALITVIRYLKRDVHVS